MSEVHDIHTSCGRIFNMTVQEMNDRQLASLIEQNQDSEALPEMEAEVARRKRKRMEVRLAWARRALEHWSEDISQRTSDRLPDTSELLPIATPITYLQAGRLAWELDEVMKIIAEALVTLETAA